MVKIKASFKMSEVKQAFDEYRHQIEDQVIGVLIELSDTVANSMRKNAEFNNHTFNLRSSLGVVVFRNAAIVHENFFEVGGGTEGLEKGKRVASENVPDHGIGMMLVAGEDYALYVEAKHNKWVISGSSMELSRELQKMI